MLVTFTVAVAVVVVVVVNVPELVVIGGELESVSNLLDSLGIKSACLVVEGTVAGGTVVEVMLDIVEEVGEADEDVIVDVMYEGVYEVAEVRQVMLVV